MSACVGPSGVAGTAAVTTLAFEVAADRVWDALLDLRVIEIAAELVTQ